MGRAVARDRRLWRGAGGPHLPPRLRPGCRRLAGRRPPATRPEPRGRGGGRRTGLCAGRLHRTEHQPGHGRPRLRRGHGPLDPDRPRAPPARRCRGRGAGRAHSPDRRRLRPQGGTRERRLARSV